MTSLAQRDTKVIWHPYTSSYSPENIPIVRAKEAYLFDEKGNAILDLTSSWWVTAHGHAHPHIAQAVAKQVHILEQVIFAGFTHEPAITLAERLLGKLSPQFTKVFYSDNGSTSVEIALKMAFQYFYNQHQVRTKVLAFEGSYHGDTFGGMSVSERDIFTAAFSPMLFETTYVPYPQPHNIDEVCTQIEQLFKTESYASCIIEPLVQGVAGMRMTTPECIDRVWKICKQYGVFAIADEVMTGFGRTGSLFACHQILTQPDLVCLSKCITGGFMAMGVTICNDKVFQGFLQEDKSKTFFHGHSFTANPLACAAANANLDIFEQPQTQESLTLFYQTIQQLKEELSTQSSFFNVRSYGGILAFEVQQPERHYLNGITQQLRSYYLSHHMLIRPLGNTIYLIPPYCTSREDLFRWKDVTLQLKV